MSRAKATNTALFVLLTTFLASTIASGRQKPSLPSELEGLVSVSLDRYAAGTAQEAVRDLAAAVATPAFTRAYIRSSEDWVSRGGSTAPRRLAAASCALEVAHARLTSHWGSLRDLLVWGAAELRKDPPSPAEYTWLRASVALAGRTRDRRWLVEEGYLRRAVDRYPRDPHLRLAFATALTIEGTFGMMGIKQRADDSQLRSLLEDRVVGSAAAVRLAELRLRAASYGDADKYARRAFAAADRATVYLAHFIVGRALEARGRREEAGREYDEALKIYPAAQSAVFALASLKAHASDSAADASTSVVATIFETQSADDPWRLLAYGDFAEWPSLLEKLRAIR